MDDRQGGLAAWQWRLYPDGHRDRRNLAVHVATVPIFQAGTLALVLAPLWSLWLAPVGLAAMAGAMAAQGRGHRLEATPPVPFRGAGDVLARILTEQWFTFPRYVFSGGLGRAWRATGVGDGRRA
ncbi:MAG: terminase [Anaeromyxobacteraceae bacterium]